MQTVMILGRQAGIGLAELESLYGAENVRPTNGNLAAVVDGEVDFGRIGGSIKAAKLLNILEMTSWKEIQAYLEFAIPRALESYGEGKLSLGLSVYGFNISPQKITATGLNIKKVVRVAGRSTRLVANKETALNSAQALHNKLTTPLGWELLLIKDGNKTILAQTTAVQDIDAYTLRDRGRPKRDARIGMLPPKLAQIIVNLTVGNTENQESRVKSQGKTVLDPFCGTGVILQEALLMGYDVLGSDLESRLVGYTKENLEWLQKKVGFETKIVGLETGDATSHQWQTPFGAVASETYLGRPFTSPPASDMLEKNMRDCDTIIRKFLKNIHQQTKPGTRFALALPAWNLNSIRQLADQIPNSKQYQASNNKTPTASGHASTASFLQLPLLDSLGELGYNRVKFAHALPKDLIYHRENQMVGRELVVLTRK